MSLFEGVELTEEQKAAIQANAEKQYSGYESPEQVAGLKQAKDALLAEKKAAEEAKALAAKEAEDRALEAAKAKGDVKAVEESLTAKQREWEEKYNGLLKENESSAINAVVSKMAAELGGESATLLEPHLRTRLRYDDGKVKVTDSEGSLTVSSIDDLAKEFKNNPAFATVIVGSRSSGGGAVPQNGKSGGAGDSSFSNHLKDLPVR